MTSNPNLFLAKRVDLVSLEHLTKRCSAIANKEDSKRCKEALEVLSSLLGVNPNNKSDQYTYGMDATLVEIVGIASETLGSHSMVKPTSTTDVFSSSKFAKYLELVKKKGAFDNLGEESSPAYQQMLDKVKNSFKQKFDPSSQMSPEEAEKKAETLKAEGNEKLKNKDFQGALDCYTQAVELSPNGPNSYIYLSNRAAAFTHLEDFEGAISDCLRAIELKPDFSKAHSRLAHAQFSLGQVDAAKKSAQRSLELDPSNGTALQTLESCRNASGGGKVATAAPSRGGGGGMPDLATMMNNPMMAQMMSDPNLASMMNNPQMMEMAQKMAQDPNAMANLMGMMGGGGGKGGRRQ